MRKKKRRRKRRKRGEGFYKCLANLNSKETVNTISGTDSSHLVKKLVTNSRNCKK